jgi:hypothetical protein
MPNNTKVDVGDHLLFVDGKFVLTSGKTPSHIHDRAMHNYKANASAEILHVVVISKYSAPEQPNIETLAGQKLT